MNAEYFAGFIDGEGTIAIRKQQHGKYFAAKLEAANTNRAVLEELASIYGGKVRATKRRQPNHKQVYSWVVTGEKMREALKQLIPYLRIKKVQAISVLEASQIFASRKFGNGRRYHGLRVPYPARVYELYEIVQLLNRRGLT